MDINDYADSMLTRIQTSIDESLKSVPKYSGAIISKVNENGTVNVYFPPDKNTIFTNISNQTPFSLAVGDSVELTLKRGDYSDCWVSAKHSSTYVNSSKESVESFNSTIADLNSQITALQAALATMESRYTALEARVAALEKE